MRGSIVLCLIILFFPLVSSLPILEFSSDEIRAGETAFATISFDDPDNSSIFYEQIDDNNIKFFEGRKEIFLESEIVFYEGVHYLSLYTTRAGEFSMKVGPVLFEDSGVLKAHTFDHALNISTAAVFFEEDNATIKQALSIRPGAWFSSGQPVIKLINKGEKILNVTIAEEVVSLGAAETYEYAFTPEQTFSLLEVSSYKDFSVPIIYLSGFEENVSNIQKESELKLDPTLLFANVIIGQSQELTLQLFNFAEENMTNISIVQGNISFLEFSGIDSVAARQTKNLTITVDPEVSGHLQGQVELHYLQEGQEKVSILAYSFFVLPSGSEESDFSVEADSCQAVEGKQCPEDCDGKGVFIEGGTFCCLGQCRPYGADDLGIDDSQSGGSGWIIGISILVVLALIGWYFWRRSKKVKPAKPEEKLQQASQRYAQQMKGNPAPNKVQGGVGRV